MPNAFTFDDGAPRQFKSRKDMYSWMAENGHVVLEGDDAPIFQRHVEKAYPETAARLANMKVN